MSDEQCTVEVLKAVDYYDDYGIIYGGAHRRACALVIFFAFILLRLTQISCSVNYLFVD